MKNSVIIGLGSNIDAQNKIQKAFLLLSETFEVEKISGIKRTAPVGITDQPDFFNAAVLLHTSLSKPDLVKVLKEMEDKMGRDRTRPKYGPREIDLDILVWNREVVDADYYHRRFLQELVAEIQ